MEYINNKYLHNIHNRKRERIIIIVCVCLLQPSKQNPTNVFWILFVCFFTELYKCEWAVQAGSRANNCNIGGKIIDKKEEKKSKVKTK